MPRKVTSQASQLNLRSGLMIIIIILIILINFIIIQALNMHQTTGLTVNVGDESPVCTFVGIRSMHRNT